LPRAGDSPCIEFDDVDACEEATPPGPSYANDDDDDVGAAPRRGSSDMRRSRAAALLLFRPSVTRTGVVRTL
jgi:hypothetical protein